MIVHQPMVTKFAINCSVIHDSAPAYTYQVCSQNVQWLMIVHQPIVTKFAHKMFSDSAPAYTYQVCS